LTSAFYGTGFCVFSSMTAQTSNKISKQQKEAMADALANFFFEYWQNQQTKGNQVAVASSGSSLRGGHPETTAAS
jgi:hypothetical protein